MEQVKKPKIEPSLPASLPKGERGQGGMRIALVHDFLIQQGGAERVLKVLGEMYPEAPIYTLLFDEEKMDGVFDKKRIHTSFLQKFPEFLKKRTKWLLPFFATAVETFDLRDFDIVISSSGMWSKGIVTKLQTIHVCYMHSPMRYAWDYNEKYLRENKEKFAFFARMYLTYLRVWDALSAKRPDYLIANSVYTQKRIEKYYRRESQVVYPPVTTERGTWNVERGNALHGTRSTVREKSYFLVVSRLSAYKRIDVIVEAFNKLGLELVVIGEGNIRRRLEKIAGEKIKILGYRSDEEVAGYYKNARALVNISDEDFGITTVEALSFGVPVIAYRKGGSLEIVREGIDGEFVDAQTVEVLADGIRRFILNEEKYDREEIKKRSGEFSEERFKEEFGEYIDKILKSEFRISNQI